MKRINIEIKDGISELLAISLIEGVVEKGRVSVNKRRKQFFYITRQYIEDDEEFCYVVSAGLTNKGHDSFIVYKERIQQ
jgi:hypothetical protein